MPGTRLADMVGGGATSAVRAWAAGERGGGSPAVIPMGTRLAEQVALPFVDVYGRAHEVILTLYPATAGVTLAKHEVLFSSLGVVASAVIRTAASLPPGLFVPPFIA